jgi:hypothetical protein
VRSSQVVSVVERVASLTLLVNLDAVLSCFGVEEGSIVGCCESLKVVSERRAHLVQYL